MLFSVLFIILLRILNRRKRRICRYLYNRIMIIKIMDFINCAAFFQSVLLRSDKIADDLILLFISAILQLFLPVQRFPDRSFLKGANRFEQFTRTLANPVYRNAFMIKIIQRLRKRIKGSDLGKIAILRYRHKRKIDRFIGNHRNRMRRKRIFPDLFHRNTVFIFPANDGRNAHNGILKRLCRRAVRQGYPGFDLIRADFKQIQFILRRGRSVWLAGHNRSYM